MKKILLAAAAFALITTSAVAQECATKAVDKNGKVLAGAAKNSNITKCCTADATAQKLSGAAKKSHVDKCKKDNGVT